MREKHDDLLSRRAPCSSCSFVRSLGAITCFACCRPLTWEGSLSPTTGPLPAAWGACLAARPSPSSLPSSRLGVRSSHSGMGALASGRPRQAAAYWPSWVDATASGTRACLRATPAMRAAAEAALRLAGFNAPPWRALADGLAAGEASPFGNVAQGWQQAAGRRRPGRHARGAHAAG